ncbi:hypothetical protein ACJMK2_043139 [Sinanodonta woodiana]|uniref:Calx-beta domain-containing protein n=1 Tax=Sinanodonta woodiana TaxID=1069815 RepID=A0ABD3VW00_SINWO
MNKAGVGRLSFANGVRYAYIEIAIIDNNIPEDEKFFTVSLVNPGGGATLGVGSVVTVVINSSDGAYGIFQFADSSLGVQAEETGDSGYNLVNLQVTRLGGIIGAADITWQLLGNQVSDIVDNNGTVSFASGQTTAFLGIKVRGDTAPELDEVYQVQLISTTRGELGNPAKLTSEITILANDETYGVFVIPVTQRPRRVDEKLQDVIVTVERLFGTFGTVDVNVSTLLPNETYAFIPQTFQRADTNDYVMSSSVIRFAPGQGIGTFTIQILDDNIPEPDEAVYVRIVSISLVVSAQIRPVANSPRVGPDSDSYGLIIINSNDNANGILELSPASPVVSESTNGTFLSVIRTGGSYGEVIVTFSVQDGTAKLGEDYLVLASQVVLLDGEKSKPVPVSIIDDYIPEQAETFAVQLNFITGGAVLGSTVSATVVIEASDDPDGAFEFSINGQSVPEPDGVNPTLIQITVFRSGGTQGVAVVDWEARLNGQLASYDVSPTNGSLYYVSNEASRNISISVLPDDIPESTEDIKITLLRSTLGRIGNRNVFTLTIPSNDNPHGVVQLSASVYTVEETSTNSVQNIGLIRTGGSFGQLRVYYNTESSNPAADPSQIPGKARDYFLDPQFGSRGIEGVRVDVPEGQEPIEVSLSDG